MAANPTTFIIQKGSYKFIIIYVLFTYSYITFFDIVSIILLCRIDCFKKCVNYLENDKGYGSFKEWISFFKKAALLLIRTGLISKMQPSGCLLFDLHT